MSEPSYNKTAVSYMALRDALIYFENAISLIGHLEYRTIFEPGTGFSMRGIYDPNTSSEIIQALVIDPLPEHLKNAAFISRLLECERISRDYYKRWAEELEEIMDQLVSSTDSPETTAESSLKPTGLESEMNTAYRRLVRDYGLNQYPICTDTQSVNQLPPEADDISLSIASLRLINANTVTLEQLSEFRKDKDAKAKLRRFRLFAYENYQGKSRAFIEDDIQKRLDDYQDTVRKWKFETKAAILTNLMDSKLVAGGVAGSFLTAYLHEPSLAVASALLTTGITIGKISVELGKRHFGLRELGSENPVSYIEYAKEKLNSDAKQSL